jgi:hypothetical protein
MWLFLALFSATRQTTRTDYIQSKKDCYRWKRQALVSSVKEILYITLNNDPEFTNAVDCMVSYIYKAGSNSAYAKNSRGFLRYSCEFRSRTSSKSHEEPSRSFDAFAGILSRSSGRRILNAAPIHSASVSFNSSILKVL